MSKVHLVGIAHRCPSSLCMIAIPVPFQCMLSWIGTQTTEYQVISLRSEVNYYYNMFLYFLQCLMYAWFEVLLLHV
jgi:hypothetical protein